MAGEVQAASGVFRSGGISYLRIPARTRSTRLASNAAVFGWKVNADRANPSFEDGAGQVIGHIHADMEMSGDAGIRPYVYVDSVADTLEKLTSNGGPVVIAPYPEVDLTVALFRDPAGNVLGIWQRA